MTFRRLSVPEFLVAPVALIALSCATLPFIHLRVAPAGIIAPLTFVVAAAAQFGTFAVLVALYATGARRSTGFLALTYGVAGFFSALAAATAFTPAEQPLIHGGPAFNAWLYDMQHLGFAACALVYAALRRNAETTLPPRAAAKYLLAVATVFAVLAVACIAGGASDAVAWANVPLLLLASVLGTAAACALVRRNGFDAALALVLVAITLGALLHLLDGRDDVVAWYASRLLYAGASTFVLIAAIRDLLRWRTRGLSLEIFLADQLHRSASHSRRLESLWKVASGPLLGDDAFLQLLLAESSSTIHAGPEFYGVISHLDGAEIVIDINQRCDGVDAALAEGARLPLADTLLGELFRAGKTCSWADVRADDGIAGIPRVRAMPWRAFIGTPFRVGPTVYFLTFTSTSALVEPFVRDDHAYLEIVASFCALRLQQRAQFDRLRHESAHDPLTGLPNRTTFRVAGARALSAGAGFALAVVDVDRFRMVNETLGHQTADALLVEVAAALTARVADGDVVARIGGDTFGVLLRDVGTREDAERRVERIHAAFSMPFGTGDREGKERVAVTASIGVAVAPDDGPSFERLLARADTAVLRSKESGRARWSFFDRRLEDAFFRARSLQNDLAHALVRGEFVLHFLPHVEIATGRLVGAEALVRWNHPERGLLSPAQFVPFAEEHGMLASIGAWVMRETVRASRTWRANDPGFRAWFNLSASELADPMLLRRLQELDEDLAGIGVEISETVAMRDVRATMHTVGALREAGLAIALDDFGTGYSSFEHLRRLPLDLVKIDGTFTAGVPDDAHDAAIVEAVIGIATRYGFATLAEGVETRRQASYLLSAGCRYAQGFAYSAPLAENVLTVQLLRNAEHAAR